MSAAAQPVSPRRSPHPSSPARPGAHKPAASATAPHVVKHTGRGRLAAPSAYDPRKGPVDRYGPVPNIFWAMAGRGIFSGIVQMAVMGYLIARTWGDGAKPASIEIVLGQFVRELLFSERMIIKVLADAANRQLIAIEKKGQVSIYRLLPENWETARAYTPALDDRDDAAADEDTDKSDEEEEVAGAKLQCDPAIVPAGGRSRSVPMRFFVKGVADPIELKLDYRNALDDYPHPLSFEASGGPKGRFCVTVRRAAAVSADIKGDSANSTGVESYEIGVRTPELQFRGRKGENASQTTDTERFRGNAAKTGQNEPENADSTLVESYAPAVTSLLREHWGFAPDPDLVNRVVTAANGAPVDYFHRRVHNKSRKTKLRDEQPGILIWCAKAAGLDYAAHQTEIARNSPARDRSAHGDALDDPHAALREQARRDPADYEALRLARTKLGEFWPTLEELGVAK